MPQLRKLLRTIDPLPLDTALKLVSFAVRMALGANSGKVTWMVLRKAQALAGGGIAVALLAAWALTGVVQSQLFDVKLHGILALVASIAGYLPVRRAAPIEPMAALQVE